MSVILHILWTIIKVIGIVLLSVIGLILFLILFVLAAPISYQAQASYYEDIEAKARVYWLYHILKICVAFKEKELKLKVSVFGLQLYPRKKKEKKRKSEKENQAVKPLAETPSTITEAFEEAVEEEKAGETEAVPVTETSGNPDQEEGLKTEETSDTVELSVTEETAEYEEMSDIEESGGKEDLSASEETSEKEEASDTEESDKAEEAAEDDKATDSEKTDEASENVDQEAASKEDADAKDAEEETAKEGGIKEKLQYGWDFLHKPSVKKLIGKLMKSIKKILKHLLPRDLQIDANLGFDDPSTTGTVMQIAALLYAFYGDHIRIIGDFEEKVMEGKASLKGRIVLGYLLLKLLGMAIRILLNKECRALYKEIRKGN